MNVYHVCEPDEWVEALAFGAIRNESLQREGFVHCATDEQLPGVLDRFYAGRDDVVVVTVDLDALGDVDCRWEAPAHPDGTPNTDAEGGMRFPHVYGPIPLDAVIDAR